MCIRDSLVDADRMPLRFRLVNLNKDFSMVVEDKYAAGNDPLAQEFVQFAVDTGACLLYTSRCV